jgi:uncharacterized membrane protein YhdT
VVRALRSWEGLLLLILVATIAVNATMSPMFLTIGNQINLFQLSIEKIIVALMMALVIINGEIDLSVASMMGLAACAFGWLFQAGVPAGLAIPMVLALGLLGGAFNAFWIAVVGIPSLVVTLAMLIGFRGVARILVEDRGITGFPAWFNALGQQPILGPLPLALIVFARALRHPPGRPAPLRLRPEGLRHRQQRRGGALFRRRRAPGQGHALHRVGRRCGIGRPPLHRPGRVPCAAMSASASSSTSSPWCSWEG